MRNRNVLLLIALILIVAAVGGGYWWLQQGKQPPPEAQATPTPQNVVPIVVAAQDIGRGQKILIEEGAVVTQTWPVDSLPLAYFTDPAEVEGKFARMDIPRGMPIVPGMLGEPGGMLAVNGSAAALFEPGRVAYAIPMDIQGAVAWAPKPGDHVDVLASIKLIQVDEEFQSPTPNLFTALPRDGNDPMLSGTYGRFETLPNGEPAFVFPAGSSVPNVVVQMTVQDAIVWHVGLWSETGGEATATTAQAAGGEPVPTPPPTPETHPEVEPVTLLVTPQDALVLKYLMEMGADLDLVLRPAGDTAPVITEPVWLQYIVDKYQLPTDSPNLPVAPQPMREPLKVTPPAAQQEVPQE